jgi:hypothetical protein
VHPFGKIFIKNETQYIIAELIGTHLASKGVGNVPELLFELFFLIVGHGTCKRIMNYKDINGL